jgi:hypothetical protein
MDESHVGILRRSDTSKRADVRPSHIELLGESGMGASLRVLAPLVEYGIF